MYLILFWRGGGYSKWNCFSIFFLTLFIVVYRKATDFCELILYSATLLKLFMMSRGFLVEFFTLLGKDHVICT
jgi:hypothetical protein